MRAPGGVSRPCKLGVELSLRSPCYAQKSDPSANRGEQTAPVGAADSSVLDKKSANRQAEPTHDRRRQKTED
jgi:hypothetical protein